jgi:putative flippase GtrA
METQTKLEPRRTPLLTSLRRSQIAAALASLSDYATLITLVELVRVWYVTATTLGGIVGAVTSFLIGRYWSFEARHGRFASQAFRYGVISGMSILLNTAGVYALKEFLQTPYLASKIVVSICVGILFNFPMHRHYVFR